MAGLINTTKKQTIVDNFIICNSHLSKARGLMFRRKKYIKNNSLIFIFKKQRIMDMHMFFVFYPIDILFLDANKKITEIKKKFLPFTVYSSKKSAKYVIELPKGSIEQKDISVNDELTW